MNHNYFFILLILLLQAFPRGIVAQTANDTTARQPNSSAADDPSQFFTRVELFNELSITPTIITGTRPHSGPL